MTSRFGLAVSMSCVAVRAWACVKLVWPVFVTFAFGSAFRPTMKPAYSAMSSCDAFTS